MHYMRWKKYGKHGPAKPHNRAPGTGSINDGYLRITKNGVTKSDHRIVMETVLGRPLHVHEKVHHKNGRRMDNRPDNLELWLKSHPPGQRVSDLIEFICRFYPNDVAKVLQTR
jgi:hypothetical protein